MGKCPPGVLCIENYTLLLVVLVIISVYFFIQYQSSKQLSTATRYMPENALESGRNTQDAGLFAKYNYSNIDNDVLLNPYEPPLRDDRIFRYGAPRGRNMGGIPINVATQSFDTDYRQVGILTRADGKEMILPLLGKPLFNNRDKWNFYTMSDKNNAIKLPVTHKGKSCTNEYGCDNLYNGDTIYVEGYNDVFKVTVYDNQVMKYIPFL